MNVTNRKSIKITFAQLISNQMFLNDLCEEPWMCAGTGSTVVHSLGPTHRLTAVSVCRYTKIGYAGNTEPQFIMPSCKHPTATVHRHSKLHVQVESDAACTLFSL